MTLQKKSLFLSKPDYISQLVPPAIPSINPSSTVIAILDCSNVYCTALHYTTPNITTILQITVMQ